MSTSERDPADEPSHSTPIEHAMGPITAAELRSIGIDSVEKVRDMGWREVFLLWIEACPERINLNAAVSLVGAERGVSWLKVAPADKDRARAVVEGLRRARRGRW